MWVQKQTETCNLLQARSRTRLVLIYEGHSPRKELWGAAPWERAKRKGTAAESPHFTQSKKGDQKHPLTGPTALKLD